MKVPLFSFQSNALIDMKIIHYIDGRPQLRIELDSEDVELAGLLLDGQFTHQNRIEVIRQFIASGHRREEAVAIVFEAENIHKNVLHFSGVKL